MSLWCFSAETGVAVFDSALIFYLFHFFQKGLFFLVIYLYLCIFVLYFACMALHNDIGQRGEEIAANYLQEQGYCILERNWTNKGRKEIDIIAIKDDVVVFVEVKTRKVGSASTPISAVNERKQRRIILAADSFVKACRIDYCCRFDVVGIIYDDDSSRIEHFVDAFRPRPKYY